MVVITRAGIIRSLFTGLTFGLLADKSTQAETGNPHRVVIQVDQNDPAAMNLALNNASNIIDYYRDKNQDVDIKVVTYGSGLHMLREDTSPVKDRIKELSNVSFPGRIAFSACRNTMEGMEAREGHSIPIIPQAGIVQSGVVYIILRRSGHPQNLYRTRHLILGPRTSIPARSNRALLRWATPGAKKAWSRRANGDAQILGEILDPLPALGKIIARGKFLDPEPCA